MLVACAYLCRSSFVCVCVHLCCGARIEHRKWTFCGLWVVIALRVNPACFGCQRALAHGDGVRFTRVQLFSQVTHNWWFGLVASGFERLVLAEVKKELFKSFLAPFGSAQKVCSKDLGPFWRVPCFLWFFRETQKDTHCFAGVPRARRLPRKSTEWETLPGVRKPKPGARESALGIQRPP